MNTLMPIGREDFADVRSGYYFVDKTTFLQAFLKNHAIVTLFTRPRRFGKTLTLSMMRYFLDLERCKGSSKALRRPHDFERRGSDEAARDASRTLFDAERLEGGLLGRDEARHF